jgi:hypothetical protein
MLYARLGEYILTYGRNITRDVYSRELKHTS